MSDPDTELDSELLLGDHVLGDDDGSAAVPAEEAAMHVITEDELEGQG